MWAYTQREGQEVLPLEHLFSTLLFPEYAGQYYAKWQEDTWQKLVEFPVKENIQLMTEIRLLFPGVHERRF